MITNKYKYPELKRIENTLGRFYIDPENNEAYFAKSSFPLSSSQNAFGLVWRMCETYELWCKEIKKEKLIKLNFID